MSESTEGYYAVFIEDTYEGWVQQSIWMNFKEVCQYYSRFQNSRYRNNKYKVATEIFKKVSQADIDKELAGG